MLFGWWRRRIVYCVSCCDENCCTFHWKHISDAIVVCVLVLNYGCLIHNRLLLMIFSSCHSQNRIRIHLRFIHIHRYFPSDAILPITAYLNVFDLRIQLFHHSTLNSTENTSLFSSSFLKCFSLHRNHFIPFFILFGIFFFNSIYSLEL